MSEQMGYRSLLSIGGTVVEYISCDIKETRELLDDEEGIRGTRSRTLERASQGLIRIGGTIKMNPTPAELALILPYCLQSSTGTTLSDALQDVTVIHDIQTIKNTFLGRFSKVKISGSPGKRMNLELTFVGKTNTVGTGGTLSGTPDMSVRPYMMQDTGSGITIGGTVYQFDDFEFQVDNHIEPTYMMGQTATDLEPSDREVHLRIRTKYNTAEAALQTLAVSGPVLGTPVAGSLAFTNGTNSATFAFGALVAQPESVHVQDKKKVRWNGNFRAYRVGSTLEVVTTLV